MNEARALRPLWLLTGGGAIGATATALLSDPGPLWAAPTLLLLGIAAFIFNLAHPSGPKPLLWFIAGLAIVGGRGLEATADQVQRGLLLDPQTSAVRTTVVIIDGWAPSRWGQISRVVVKDAKLRETTIDFPRSCRIEVRGATDAQSLPAPGSVITTLARPTGDPGHPMLVVSSARLLRPTGEHSWLPGFRDRLAHKLIAAAGTDAGRIRAAEMAAVLALGRRDLVPRERRERWRRSGLAHLLAVSGLHVGIVGGSIWLLTALLGAGPKTTRLVALVTIPAYAILAGASPSAMRAALMAVIYFGARFLGRAVLPMAAVLLAALVLLVKDPGTISEPGFQLTVLITAALVRWVPRLAEALPGPQWLTGALAVPVVAQAAAMPIVAWHFHSLIPGSIIANMLALPLLGPTVLASVAAALLAPIWQMAAVACLAVLQLLMWVLAAVSAPARAIYLLAPKLPVVFVIGLIGAGLFALLPTRRAKWGVVAWLLLLLVATLRFLPNGEAPPTVELLPVSDGAAVVFESGSDVILFDAGRYLTESAQLLAESGRRKLRALLISHTDQDHIGGAARVLENLQVERLILPRWMLSDINAVPVLRAARKRGTHVAPVARGSATTTGTLRLEVLWPPARRPPTSENERSLVVRAVAAGQKSLLTADIGRVTERRLERISSLKCGVLVVSHHGSRASTSSRFIKATAPSIALIPAAPGNTHGHPHAEVLERLANNGIIVRVPRESESCGARWEGGRWIAFP